MFAILCDDRRWWEREREREGGRDSEAHPSHSVLLEKDKKNVHFIERLLPMKVVAWKRGYTSLFSVSTCIYSHK